MGGKGWDEERCGSSSIGDWPIKTPKTYGRLPWGLFRGRCWLSNAVASAAALLCCQQRPYALRNGCEAHKLCRTTGAPQAVPPSIQSCHRVGCCCGYLPSTARFPNQTPGGNSLPLSLSLCNRCSSCSGLKWNRVGCFHARCMLAGRIPGSAATILLFQGMCNSHACLVR